MSLRRGWERAPDARNILRDCHIIILRLTVLYTLRRVNLMGGPDFDTRQA